MRIVDALFGPSGAIKVEFDCDGRRGYATVICRNGLTDKQVTFVTDTRTGEAIKTWIETGKHGLIQEVAPDLDANERELCLSGITAPEWDRMWKEEEDA